MHRTSIVSLALVLLATGCAAPAAAKSAGGSPLDRILSQIDQEVDAGRQPVVVFDLDDTLFDTRARHLWIMQTFADRIRAEHPDEAEKLDGAKVEEIGYTFGGNLDRIRFADDPNLREHFAAYWAQHFFSDLCASDPPIPGAGAYVAEVYERGALVVYLTGRDTARMLKGSVEALEMAGFPIGVQRTELIMKPDKDISDETFKGDVMAYLGRIGVVVGAFENEPFNINLLHRSFPEATAVFLDTRHKPEAPEVEQGIESLEHYR